LNLVDIETMPRWLWLQCRADIDAAERR